MEEFDKTPGKPAGVMLDLLLPVLSIISAAAVILFATAKAVPGQFIGRHFAIPEWTAVIAALVLVVSTVIRVRGRREMGKMPPKDQPDGH